ncbi:MAG: TIGR00725 family protein, partial [Actinomycetota bacterium]|nr:TIGR00725 family protein [Actinomycetota bacterium]
MVRSVYVAVVGPGDGPDDLEAVAEALGAALARRGAVVVCGGLGGAM